MTNSQELQRPPRSLPFTLGVQCLLGGLSQQVGWGIFTFGMIFVLVFGSQLDLPRSWAFQGELAQVQGVVTGFKETSAEVNERTVVEYFFDYSVQEIDYKGSSYTSTTGFDNGEPVTVEYTLEDPGVSRIQGTNVSVFSPWILLLILIFPAIGLIFVVIGFRHGIKSRALLARGEMALGKLVSKEATSGSVNDQPIYDLTFEFEARSSGRTHQVVARTHDTESLEDEEQERLLYQPSDPDVAVLFDNLPGKAKVGMRGNLEGGSFLGMIGVMILPALGICLTALTVLVMIPLD